MASARDHERAKGPVVAQQGEPGERLHHPVRAPFRGARQLDDAAEHRRRGEPQHGAADQQPGKQPARALA
ncbi:MAG: hypothetical protein KBG35_07330, partial [Thauera sp.]|nr:hypothetical protein [Thauera sp.]